MTVDTFQYSLAVVIGIDDYHNGVPSLKTPVNDAQTLATILQDHHGYEVKLLLNEAANGTALKELLETELPQRLFKDDRLLFYFAGHGIALNGDDGPEGYLIPSGARLGDISTYLSMATVNQALLKLPCRHFLGILDCCFAGAFRWSSTRKLVPIELGTIHKERFDRFIQDPAWQVITSAASDQFAQDVFDLKSTQRGLQGNHSPFAAALIEALEGSADAYPPAEASKPAGDGVITATELYLYLRDRVEPDAETRAMRQTPGIFSLTRHDKGEFIFLSPGHPLNLPPAPPLDESSNPYRGLESFDEAHKDLFFGRQALTQTLAKFVTNHLLTIVLGASGSGKSSLVKAGLIPQLRQLSNWYFLPPFRPGESPFKALNQALGSVNIPEISTAATITQNLTHWFEEHPQAHLLVIVDQLEELTTLCQDQQERQQFLVVLAEASATHPTQLHLVLTLRSDFEPQFRNTALEPAWQGARFVVPAMTRDELRQAIEAPASARVMVFDPHELVDQLVDEVANMPGALPLLSFALSELYLNYLKRQEQARNEGETLDRAMTQADYAAMGGVTQSLTQRADQEYATLVQQDKAYEQIIRHVMLRMVAVGGGELARRQVPLSELQYPPEKNSLVKEVIERFIKARLLVKGEDTEGNPYVEPAHDALVRGWQKLLEWKRKEQESLLLQRRLTPAAEEWQSQQQARFLWNTNPRLDLLKKVLSSDDNWLNKVEAEFVQCSVGRRVFNTRRNWGIAVGVIMLLSSAAVFASKKSIEAQNQLLESNSALTENLLSSGKELDALIKATETGERLKNTWIVTEGTKIKVLTMLQKVIYGVRERNRLPGEEMILSNVSFSPDGKTIASAGSSGTIKLWSGQGKPLGTLRHYRKNTSDNIVKVIFSRNGQLLISASFHSINLWQRQPDDSFILHRSIADSDGIMTLALSPDNTTIAAASLGAKNTIKLQSLDGKVLNRLEGHRDRINDLSFSADGRTIASASADKTIKLWSTKDAKLLGTISESGPMFAVRFVDDQTIAYAGANRMIKLWNLKAGKLRREFLVHHSDDILRLVLSQDGKMLASASRDHSINLWSLDGTLLHTLSDYEKAVTDISFSPNNKIIASISEDNTLRTWSLDNGAPILKGNTLNFSPNGQMIVTGGDKTIGLWRSDGTLLKRFQGHGESIIRVSFSPDSRIIATASADHTVKLWDLDGNLLQTLQGHKQSVTSISFSPDGHMIASGSLDRTVKLWDLQGKLLQTFQGHKQSVTSVSFSPDSQMIASSSRDCTIKLWDLQGNPLQTVTGHTKAVLDISFSPDGTMLASAGEDKTVILRRLNRILWYLNVEQTKILPVHKSNIFRVKFSPNGQTLTSVSKNEIKLWTLDGNLLQDLSGKNVDVQDISFSPGGETFALSNLDRVVILDLDLNKLLKRSCSLLHDYLTYSKDSQVSVSKNRLCNRSSYLPNW
jgi:WD40 repeat protein